MFDEAGEPEPGKQVDEADGPTREEHKGDQGQFWMDCLSGGLTSGLKARQTEGAAQEDRAEAEPDTSGGQPEGRAEAELKSLSRWPQGRAGDLR